MKKFKLTKQHHMKPEFEELDEMISDLFDFLDEDVNLNDIIWNENIDTVLDFQDSDGSFKLFDSYRIPSDAVVDFCYMPTYICTAILMKAYMTGSSNLALKLKKPLSKALEKSCARNLRGHGFEALKQQIEALNIFMKGGLREFIDLHPDVCPKFTEMIGSIAAKFSERVSGGDFIGPWNRSYEKEIRAVNEYFSYRNVFVYGTLMTGECNHGYLKNSLYLGPAALEGHVMYNVGWYPAIVSGEGIVIGEVYDVPNEDMPSIDKLEGEGELYCKKCEMVSVNGKKEFVLFYVYLQDCCGLVRISSWKNEYLWYVSYGSNMLNERLMCYIKGGSYAQSRHREACGDTTPPLLVRTVDIPYAMYFGNSSGSWQDGGVSFLDTTEKGHALGVAYLISRWQFEHISREENCGRDPKPGYGWYEDIIDLGKMDGFEVKTITNRTLRDYNRPCGDYLDTLRKGIRQNWPDMLDGEIEDYLDGCIR